MYLIDAITNVLFIILNIWLFINYFITVLQIYENNLIVFINDF